MSFENYTIDYSVIPSKTEIIHLEDIKSLTETLLNNKDSVRRLFVTDATVASLPVMQEFTSNFDDDKFGNNFLLVLGSGEPYKNFETVLTIVEKALEYGFTRNDIFVGIGGGVICDTTAFAASIYKRGIAVELVPTTLVCMVDSAIGGKTSCNHANHKNIIGTYHPASKVYYISKFVESLSENQYRSGLAEAFKTAILFDKELYNIFKNNTDEILNRDKDIIDEIIIKSSKTKAKITTEDFLDKDKRVFLNLGHTFSYALETVIGMGIITHGEGVAWGISRAVTLAWKKDYCLEAFKNEVFEILEKFGFITEPIPPVVQGGGPGDRILQAMHEDKKTLDEKIRIVIPHNVEEVTFEEVSDTEILSVLR